MPQHQGQWIARYQQEDIADLQGHMVQSLSAYWHIDPDKYSKSRGHEVELTWSTGTSAMSENCLKKDSSILAGDYRCSSKLNGMYHARAGWCLRSVYVRILDLIGISSALPDPDHGGPLGFPEKTVHDYAPLLSTC